MEFIAFAETPEGVGRVLFSLGGPKRRLEEDLALPCVTLRPRRPEDIDLVRLSRAVWPAEPDLGSLGRRFGLNLDDPDPWRLAEALGKLFLLALEEVRSWPKEPREALAQILPQNFLVSPKPRPRSFPTKNLAEAFQRLGERLSWRPSQWEYACRVAEALEKGEIVLLEASPGTGKTFGYLIPVLLALQKGGRAVVVTRTKTLQDQLWKKDLPWLEETLGIRGPRALLKGRENYLCLRKLAELELKLLPEHVLWPLRVFAGRGGDLDELGFVEDWIVEELRDRPWRCSGFRCQAWSGCPSRKAREAARQAKLVVANHAVLGADLAMDNALLGPYDFLIVDEAHALYGALREAMSIEITPGELPLILSELRRRELGEERKEEEVRARHRMFWEKVRSIIPTGRTRLKPEMIEALWEEGLSLCGSLFQLVEALQKKNEEELASGLLGYAQALRSLFFPPPGRWVPWANHEEEVSLGLTPLELAGELSQKLWPRVRAAVLTSATLSVRKSPKFVRSRLGLPEETPFFFWPSPFSYERVRIAVLAYLPEPDHPDHPRALAETLRRALRTAPVKAMVLFTAKRALASFRAQSGDLPHLAQGWDGERDQLLRRFRALPPPAILLGLESFWEGVDLPGAELELLVVARLPFPHPADPVLEAEAEGIRAQGKSDFHELSLPLAVLKLRQGLGRLVRTPADRGVVLIADPRLAFRSYKGAFLSALPVAPRVLQTSEELDVVLAEVFR